ncbi:hypothetical protein MMC30_005980 [Trapelia coarctata]|nr:hypothetical protein [Trapelia coarctata]
MHKEEMIREIRALREKNNWVERILRAIRADDDGAAIIERLRNGESYEAISKTLDRPPFSELPQLSPKFRVQLTKAIAEHSMDMEGEGNAGTLMPGTSWSNVTDSESLMDTLMALYFTWVHPVHMLFSENHFMASYKNQSDLYCTSALVNAVCAMGCHLLDVEKDERRLWPGIDTEVLREKFLKEALKKLPQDSAPKMTTIQAYAILFLVDLGSGKGSRASHYIRLAGDALNARLEYHYATEAMEITRWGIYALNVLWASVTFQVPSVLPASAKPTEVFRNVLLDTHDDLWRFYRHTGDETAQEHPSSAILVARETAKLMLHVHRTIDILYDRRAVELSADEMVGRYKAYLEWEAQLPETMAPPHGIAEARELQHLTAHVLSLHIHYHTAVIHLFQPLLYLPNFTGTARQQVMDITIDHARRSYEAHRLYKELYSCRYQPSVQSFCLLHAGDILIRLSPTQPSATTVVENCLLYLKEAADGKGGFPVCGPLQEMFRRSAVECNVRLPDNVYELMGEDTNYTSEMLLDACTRLSYRQPVERVVANMEDTVSADFTQQLGEQIKALNAHAGRSAADTRRIQIDELLNNASDSMEF